MKIQNPILSGLVSGLLFAVIMTLIDSFSEEPFVLLKFLFRFIFFGAFMAFFAHRRNKQSEKK